jgi:DNA-binding CsgD family transcriptional regulator
MAKSTAVRAAARIKQLSCFGLGKEAVIPELLNELHGLIPSYYNSFFFADEKGAVANAYFEHTDLVKLFPLYRQEFHESREREFKGFAFSDAVRTQFGVHEFKSAVSVEQKTFYRSDLYNLVFRPMGNDSNFMRLYFRDGGRVLGGLTMWRAKNAGTWTSEEKRRLASLESFFVHALTARTVSGVPLVDSGDVGLIIANTAGKPIYLSAEGRRLLFLATNPRSVSDTLVSRPAVLPTPVAKLCRSLSRIFSDDASAAAPMCHHANVWGGFTFRAQWLDRDDPGSGLIGLTISHQVPLPIRLTRSVQKLPLSRRQSEVCVLLATGASNEAIAERLGISRHTANEHGRWIYNKLDVHNRAELVNRLLSS